jgi:hypothetical protein
MNLRSISLLALMILISFSGYAIANDVPAQLPDPDGTPGDATKPVQVYILAGQSNMVGMGELTGARCRYNGIYLSADPAAPKTPVYIHGVGHVKIETHGVYASASIYAGTYDPNKDYNAATPVKTETISLGVVQNTLPRIDGPRTVVVRGFIDVPESGVYVLNPGYGDSAYNVLHLDGQEVYRKNEGEQSVKQEVALEAGQRYAIKITYFEEGSTAFWMSRQDLLGKGDLEIATKRDNLFPNLIDGNGEWTVRNDVYYQEARLGFSGSPLSPISNGRTIGPELGFGHVMGTYHGEQVLLIKTAQGNRSLGYDFRPPSSGRTDPDSEWEGAEYRLMVEGVRKTLDQIDQIVPGYEGQGYELAGFVWWQGHKDGGGEDTIAEYEHNLVNLINDVREEFDVPNMPAVVATVGFGGRKMSDTYLRILEAQLAVGDPQKHPEFAGTAASVDTRDFWREVDESPSDQDYHYNRNAETYMLVGDALGRAMVGLLGGQAEAIPQTERPHPVAQQEILDPTPEEEAATRAAMAPIVIDGMVPKFIADNRDALLSQANGEKPQRVTPFLRDTIYGLTQYYQTVGIDEYDWHVFGPKLKSEEWDYYSFDPPETQPKDDGKPRYRTVTYPEGMSDWFSPDFDPTEAGWDRGPQPFGQLGGELHPLSETCASSFCGCGNAPKSLWEKEVLLMRGTFEFPPLKEGHRYRIVVGGSAHVNAGEGYAIYINGRQLIEYPSGVFKNQGGQPRGAFIDKEFVQEFQGGEVTIAATSFLRYFHPREGSVPPRGHISLWLEEMKIPPLGE